MTSRTHIHTLVATAGLLVTLAACGATHQSNPTSPKATTSAASAGAATQPKSSSGGGVVPTAGVSERTVIKTPGAPSDVAHGFGSIWVAVHRGLTLYRIDPRTNGVTAISMPDGSCGPPVITPTAVWYGSCDNGNYKLDPNTNRIVGHSPCCGDAYGAGSLWRMDLNAACRLLRVDPQTGVVLARIETGIPAAAANSNDGCQPVAVAYGSIWIYSPTLVARVDTATNKLTRLIRLPGGKDSGEVAGGYTVGGFGTAAGGKVWVTNVTGVFAIDPRTNTARLLPIKITPFRDFASGAIASGAGSVWFRAGDHTIARVDASTGRLTATYPGDDGGGLTYADGSLWLAEFIHDTTLRERLK